ncbi:MAG TPA: STAS domain-containing protein [Bryobacteraceae bacterium]|nr:STAS domain-containing protein [Bryobacteraceae bacterium]
MLEFRMEWLPDDEPEIRVLKLSGPFTLNAVFDFQSAVRQPWQGATIIDLTEVPLMDSAALGSLLGLHVSCQRDQRAYVLLGVGDRLKTLFRVSGVTGLLVMADSLEQAKAVKARTASA